MATETETRWSLDDPDHAMYVARRRPMSTWEWRTQEWALRTLAREYRTVKDVEMVIVRDLSDAEREIVETELAAMAKS